jgi:hypothetical protein
MAQQVVVLWLLGANAARGAPIAHHCAPGEQVVMSCTIEGKTKVLSLCASPGATAEQGYLQYRYGNPGNVELEYPSDRSVPPGRAFEHRVILHPPGGFSSYSFTVKSHRYSVFSMSHAGDESAGVKVDKTELSCGNVLWGSGPDLPNQDVLEIKEAARAVLAGLDRSPSCGGEAREHWRQTAEGALQLQDTAPLEASLMDEGLLEELRAMTCP